MEPRKGIDMGFCIRGSQRKSVYSVINQTLSNLQLSRGHAISLIVSVALAAALQVCAGSLDE